MTEKIKKVIRFVFSLPIIFYRKFISPLKPPCCKYYPTCSQYALTAIERFGIFYGGWLAFKRILRCNPWSLGGVDHVPEKKIK
ncbi:MAG: membrane protein insertion efficiency factor YidD [Oscillospiraceae bacterium]